MALQDGPRLVAGPVAGCGLSSIWTCAFSLYAVGLTLLTALCSVFLPALQAVLEVQRPGRARPRVATERLGSQTAES
jgi:hypothetical protein